MKMYHFTRNTYAAEFHIMAESKDSALESLRMYCLELSKKELERDLKWYGDTKEYVFPNRVTYPNDAVYEFPTEMDGIKDQYAWNNYQEFLARPECIKEYNVGEVVQTEVC